MIKDQFPLYSAIEARALAAHLRRYLSNYRKEIRRRIVIRKATARTIGLTSVVVYYDMDDNPLRQMVSERAPGFSVGWNVARKGIGWA